MSASRLGYLAAAALLVAIFLSLSAWQYGQGEQKQQWIDAWQAALAAPPVEMAAALRGSTPRTIADTFVPDEGAGWILLDNQRRGAEVGVKAYRILRSAEGVRVLADFGWVPWPSRDQLPSLDPPPASVPVLGLWVDWPGQGIALGPNPLDPARRREPVLLTYLDRGELASWAGLSLAAGVLRVGPESPYGFVRELAPLPNTLPPDQHYGYALQWFGFAVALVVIVVVLSWKHRAGSTTPNE